MGGRFAPASIAEISIPANASGYRARDRELSDGHAIGGIPVGVAGPTASQARGFTHSPQDLPRSNEKGRVVRPGPFALSFHPISQALQ
jgi:hypothetical protein